MNSEPFPGFTMLHETGAAVRIKESLCGHKDIKANPDALAAVINICDKEKDSLRESWADRQAKGTGRQL